MSRLTCRRVVVAGAAADIHIRAQTVVDAGKAIYTSKLLLGGVLANETDKLFMAKGKAGAKK